MYYGFYEEGNKCPKCFDGELEYIREGSCSCHISAPCSACVNKILECNKCGYQPDESEYKEVLVTPSHYAPYVVQKVYKPKLLDNTKIDYRIKGHTACSQICEVFIQ